MKRITLLLATLATFGFADGMVNTHLIHQSDYLVCEYKSMGKFNPSTKRYEMVDIGKDDSMGTLIEIKKNHLVLNKTLEYAYSKLDTANNKSEIYENKTESIYKLQVTEILRKPFPVYMLEMFMKIPTQKIKMKGMCVTRTKT